MWEFLQAARAAREAEQGADYRIGADLSCFGTVYQELAAALAAWPELCLDAIRPQGWDLAALQVKGAVPRPELMLASRLDKDGTLLLEWRPVTGFVAGLGLPPRQGHRLLGIAGIGALAARQRRGELYTPAEQCLFQALQVLWQTVERYLRYFVVVQTANRVHLAFRDEPTGKRLERAGVITPQRQAALVSQGPHRQWLRETFLQLGLSADEFAALASDCQGNPVRLARAVRERTTLRVTPGHLQKILQRLEGVTAGAEPAAKPGQPG